MSFGALLSFAFGLLGPIALETACIFEYIAQRKSRDRRPDEARIAKLRQYADIGLVAAWLLLAAAYLGFQHIAPDAAALEAGFQKWMTWMLGLLLLFDVEYLYLRRSRPREPGKKKKFWEI